MNGDRGKEQGEEEQRREHPNARLRQNNAVSCGLVPLGASCRRMK
jgi:hypothetical protein